MPVPPLAGVKALVKLREANSGVEVVIRFWLILEEPYKAKVLLLP